MDHRPFLKLFLPDQTIIKAYLLAATRDLHEAEDLFQETSAVLWEKFASYDASRPFRAWALGVARLEVLKWRETRQQSREVVSAETLQLLADAAPTVAAEAGERGLHLMGCLDWLKGVARQAIELRYAEMLSIRQIAERLGKNVAAVEMILVRARRALQDCVERKLGAVGEAR